MIKFIGISFVAIVLSGCNPSYTDKSTSYLMPEGMKDCKVYVLDGDASSKTLTVVRCPSSDTSTTYNVGKSSYETVNTN